MLEAMGICLKMQNIMLPERNKAFIEGRVAEIESTVAQAEIIDVSKLSGTVIKFGATRFYY